MGSKSESVRREVIKHSAAIQITNRITLLQRRAWNVLLEQAYDELLTAQVHTLGVDELVDRLGITTRNTAHLRSILKGLTTTAIEWNVLGKDGGQWGVASLLAYVKIEGGVCTYGFGPMASQLYNPTMYARIKLSTANKFGSKHALALYELAVDYLRVWQTPWIQVTAFRELMGLDDDEYPEWYELRRRVIAHSVTEVNRVSDLTVKLLTQKEGRSVTAVKFTIQPKERTPAAAVATSTPGRVPMPSLPIQVEADPYGDWVDGLSPLERGAFEAQAEAAVSAKKPDAKGVLRTVALIEEMRAIWKEHK
jgi:hypothetical protein